MPIQKARESKKQPVRVSGDPEMFIARVVKDGSKANRRKIIPVCGLIGGTKQEPIDIPGAPTRAYKMQEDGVALEVNFPPSTDYQHFSSNVDLTMALLQDFLAKKDLMVVPKVCSHKFTQTEIDEFPQAQIVGCSPDVDAYQRRPREGINTNLFGLERFTAGHFHISFPNPHNIPNYIYARMLDAFITLPALPVDKQGSRRKFYGLAGLYRDTSYPDGTRGIEYRTMSNFWLFDIDSRRVITHSIINNITRINKDVDAAAAVFDAMPWGDVKNCIDNEDLVKGKQLYDFISNISRPLGGQLISWGAR